MSQLPSSVRAVVIGAGIHGLSIGWHHVAGGKPKSADAPRFATGARHR
jgi:hypothetical protein